MTKQHSLVERMRAVPRNAKARSRHFKDSYFMTGELMHEAADEIEQLGILVEHLRHCRTCSEADIADCEKGRIMWRATIGEP